MNLKKIIRGRARRGSGGRDGLFDADRDQGLLQLEDRRAYRPDQRAPKCTSGTVAISWNRTGPAGQRGATDATGAVGPQGPAGVSVGFSQVGSSQVQYSQAAPAVGTYYVNGSVTVNVAAGDQVSCSIDDRAPAFTAANNTGGAVTMTIPVTGSLTVNSGAAVIVPCADVQKNVKSVITGAAFLGILVNQSSGTLTVRPAARAR